jgi:acyl carrier protein
MDSLEMRELLAECEQRFKIQVLWDDIDQLVETGKQIQIQDLVDYIAERQNQID